MSRFTTSTFVFAVVVATVAVMSPGGINNQHHQVDAFATPGPSVSSQQRRVFASSSSTKGAGTVLKMGFFNDEERKPLTRESEPEEFFATYVFFFRSFESI